MNTLQVPEFKTYEEEATFWDNLDTSVAMEDDNEWFHFETPNSDEPKPKGKLATDEHGYTRIKS